MFNYINWKNYLFNQTLARKCNAALQLTLKLFNVGATTHEGQPPQINSQPVGNTKRCSSMVNLQYSTLLRKMHGFLPYLGHQEQNL